MSAAISAEPSLTAEPTPQPAKRWQSSWLQSVASAAAVAGVATVAIFWMRAQVPESPVAVTAAIDPIVTTATGTGVAKAPTSLTPVVNNTDSPSYTVPKTPGRRLVVPSTELANYVVAHSEFSSPVARRNLLSAFMASESANEATSAGTSAGSGEPIEDVQDDAKNPQ